jgi:hypothetical protein
MESDKILGCFNPFDDIYINLYLNGVTGTSYPTLIHESCHKLLTFSTSIGFLEYFLFIELYFSQDQKHSNHIINLIKVIFEFTTKIQEVYANNIELIMIRSEFGKEWSKSIYKTYKPSIYKSYYNELKKINQDEKMEDSNKIKIITKICIETLNIDIYNDKFIESMDTPKKFDEYLKENYNLEKIFNENIQKYLSNRDLCSNLCVENDQVITISKLISEKNTIIKYSKNYFDEFIKDFNGDNINRIINEIRNNKIDANYEFLKKTKIYNFSNMKHNMTSQKEFLCNIFATCIIFKNYSVNKFQFRSFNTKNYIIVGLANNGRSISTVGDKEFVKKVIEQDKIFGYCIVDCEYNIKDKNHYTLKSEIANVKSRVEKNELKKMYVLINDYKLCCNIIKSIENGGKLVYNMLSGEDTKSTFSTLIFRDLNNSNIIYFYPTIAIISNKISEIFENINNAEYVKKGTIEEIIGNVTFSAVVYNSIYRIINLCEKNR